MFARLLNRKPKNARSQEIHRLTLEALQELSQLKIRNTPKNKELMRFLKGSLKEKIHPLATFKDTGHTAFIIAAINNHVKTMRALYMQWPNGFPADIEGRTALMHAAQRGNIEAAHFLLNEYRRDINESNGIEIDARSRGKSYTALTYAVKAHYVPMASFLLNQGAIFDKMVVAELIEDIVCRSRNMPYLKDFQEKMEKELQMLRFLLKHCTERNIPIDNPLEMLFSSEQRFKSNHLIINHIKHLILEQTQNIKAVLSAQRVRAEQPRLIERNHVPFFASDEMKQKPTPQAANQKIFFKTTAQSQFPGTAVIPEFFDDDGAPPPSYEEVTALHAYTPS